MAGLLGGQTAYGDPPYERPEFWIFYDGLTDWEKLIGNSWSLPTPAMSSIERYILTWAINKGAVAVNFQVVLQAQYPGYTQEFRSGVVRLTPEQRGRFEIAITTWGSGVRLSGSYVSGMSPWVFQLYADGIKVDEVRRTITTF